MARRLYTGEPPADALGVLVHGPLLLARAAGVAVGLRCVFGYPGGLSFALLLHATGVHAEAAARQTGYLHRPGPPAHERISELAVTAEVDGVGGPVAVHSGSSWSNDDRYVQEASCWVDVLPADGIPVLSVGWTPVGLPETRTELRLRNIDSLGSGVITLG